MKLFIIAGESSGDWIGAEILKGLREKDPQLKIAGVGGDLMMGQGLRSLFPMTDLSLMGIVEVVKALPRVFRCLSRTKAAIEEFQPDAVLTIDSPDFSFRIGKWAHKKGFKVHHVVAPSVWAWRPGRAKKIAQFLDHLYCLFPFEPDYFTSHGLSASFVGHPLASIPLDAEAGKAFRQKRDVAPDTPLLCVLPGSRKGEVETLVPIFQETVKLLQQTYPDLHLVLPTVPAVADWVRTQSWACPTLIVTDPDEKTGAMKASNAALAASGTVTLELGYFQVPTVVAYKVHPLTAWIGRKLIQVPYVSLPNILLKEEVFPEHLQENCHPDLMTQRLLPLLAPQGDLDQAHRLRLLQQLPSLLRPPHGPFHAEFVHRLLETHPL